MCMFSRAVTQITGFLHLFIMLYIALYASRLADYLIAGTTDGKISQLMYLLAIREQAYSEKCEVMAAQCM